MPLTSCTANRGSHHHLCSLRVQDPQHCRSQELAACRIVYSSHRLDKERASYKDFAHLCLIGGKTLQAYKSVLTCQEQLRKPEQLRKSVLKIAADSRGEGGARKGCLVSAAVGHNGDNADIKRNVEGDGFPEKSSSAEWIRQKPLCVLFAAGGTGGHVVSLCSDVALMPRWPL